MIIDMEIIDNEALSEKVGIIARQTDYDEETIKQKLIDYGYDHMKIIKEYLGLDKKISVPKPSSVNQEIYKQIRKKMEISDYNKKQDEKLATEIENNQK
jgi:FPC/CPF motif-containing protein YcgG